jgi:hypothetical protein
MGGQSMVIRLYKYLSTPIAEDKPNGKVYCIVDTDNQRCEEINNGFANLTIKRLCNKGSYEKTSLLTLDNKITNSTDIEQSLDAVVFKETIEQFTDEKEYQIDKVMNEDGNTDFRENFRSFSLENLFKVNDGENKILFATQYIEISEQYSLEEVTPDWIKQVKKFFK